MVRRGRDLASRLKRALDEEQGERARQQREAEQARAEGRAERDALLADLAELASAIGHLRVRRPKEGGLILERGERSLTLAPEGDGDRVRVDYTGRGEEIHALYRQVELGGKWVWSIRRGEREDRIPLFDLGLEELLVRALGLPRPSDR